MCGRFGEIAKFSAPSARGAALQTRSRGRGRGRSRGRSRGYGWALSGKQFSFRRPSGTRNKMLHQPLSHARGLVAFPHSVSDFCFIPLLSLSLSLPPSLSLSLLHVVLCSVMIVLLRSLSLSPQPHPSVSIQASRWAAFTTQEYKSVSR